NNGYAYVINNGRITVYVGSQYKKIKDLLEGEKYRDAEIKGMCACPGKVKGKVRVILNPIGAKINDEVLVTFMTRPDFVPLMKNSIAIITEEGGVTSHAAVISREMKKPCIVGVKNLTNKLKNGDLVEVDATKGEVRKLE
ncbi:PEP-utilizing enzyme, partial [Nanoarchaeota archaeon]